jgi:hypothetical protein
MIKAKLLEYCDQNCDAYGKQDNAEDDLHLCVSERHGAFQFVRSIFVGFSLKGKSFCFLVCLC